MSWFINAIIGAIIGFVYSTLFIRTQKTMALITFVAIVGGLVGTALFTAIDKPLFGPYSVYLFGALFSFLLAAGGHYAFTLTGREKRV